LLLLDISTELKNYKVELHTEFKFLTWHLNQIPCMICFCNEFSISVNVKEVCYVVREWLLMLIMSINNDHVADRIDKRVVIEFDIIHPIHHSYNQSHLPTDYT